MWRARRRGTWRVNDRALAELTSVPSWNRAKHLKAAGQDIGDKDCAPTQLE